MHIAVNVVRDFARNRRLQFWRRVPSIDPVTVENWLADSGRSPEANVMLEENVRAIWAAAEKVSPKQRTAFLLRFVEDMELLEIADVMGISESAVKVHLFRAVHAVRKRLRITA
jgi:RNA polymerase sigma-70 factor (ECF subfamily)